MRSGNESEITQLRDRLTELEDERTRLLQRIGALERSSGSVSVDVTGVDRVNANSSNTEKISFFRTLFASRSDVYARRWENSKSGRSGYAPACSNEWLVGTCNKPQIKCSECLHQAFLPLSADVIEQHLRGASGKRSDDFVVGAYPLLPDGTCWFVAADFDGDAWSSDAEAYLEACRAKSVPAALERSRSGNGGHVWIFFAEALPAREARKLGSLLLTAAMERRPEIAFSCKKLTTFRFIVCCIPFFAYDIALGDEVETDAEFVFRRVVRCSGRPRASFARARCAKYNCRARPNRSQ